MSLVAFALGRAPTSMPLSLRLSAAAASRAAPSLSLLSSSSSSISSHSGAVVARLPSPRSSLHSACTQASRQRTVVVATRSFSSGGEGDAADPTSELVSQLQSLQVRPDTDTAAIERVASSYPASAWTRTALHVYLGCFDIVPDGSAALGGFRRIVAAAGLTPLPQSYAKLMRAILYDWTPHHAESLDSVRAEMLARRPALRFSSSDVGVLLPLACMQTDTARRLQQWAKEDGVWEKLQPPVQRRLADACQPPRRW